MENHMSSAPGPKDLASADRYRTLLEINNAIVTNLNQEDLPRAISTALRRVIPFDRAAFTLYLPKRDVFRFLAIEGLLGSSHFRPGWSSTEVKAFRPGYSITSGPRCATICGRNKSIRTIVC
jgi:hypothetical protein